MESEWAVDALNVADVPTVDAAGTAGAEMVPQRLRLWLWDTTVDAT